jgi:hypothetical protein
MTATGFTHERATPHQEALRQVFGELARRGYRPRELEVSGDRPDVRITDADQCPAYVDVKVPQPGSGNIAVKLRALETYERIVLMEQRHVYIVVIGTDGRWTVDTVDTARARIIQGPRRRSGNGSRTDWVLIACGGTDFDDYFPSI